MERLKERLEIARRALNALAGLAGKSNPGTIERDAAIQRFEYSFAAFWKAAQRCLCVS